MGTWKNADNLFLKFGTDKATANNDGEYRTNGALREIEVKIDLTGLTESEVIQSDAVFFPKMRIEEVEIVTHTAAATGTAIDIGLVQSSDRSTAIDADGLVAALVTASMNAAGEKNVLRVGSTSAGALIGTTTSSVGHITASRTDATAFTAGVIFVRIRYYAV